MLAKNSILQLSYYKHGLLDNSFVTYETFQLPISNKFLLFVLIGIHKCLKITQVKINLTLNQPFPILISEKDIVINSLSVGWGCIDKIDYDGRLF